MSQVVTILGTGGVAKDLGQALANKGFDVVFGTRRAESDEVKALLASVPRSRAHTTNDAIAASNIVFLAIPGNNVGALVEPIAEALAGKIVVDLTNPIGEGLVASVDHRVTSNGEIIQQAAPKSKVVKAFNTIGSNMFLTPVVDGVAVDLYVGSNDADAKKAVLGIAEQLGFQPVDCGPLRIGRYTEPLCYLWVFLAHPQGFGRNMGFKLIRK